MEGKGTLAYNNPKEISSMKLYHGSIQQQTLEKNAYEEFLQFVATNVLLYKSFTNLCQVKTYDALWPKHGIWYGH
jgi:hypothetical protein